MLTLGLLWYDDDARRPVPQKIAEAVARYQERVGGRPTVCQLNPRQAASLASAKAAALPHVRLVPDETLRSNYFLVGIEEGEAGAEPQMLAHEPDMPMPVEDTSTSRRTRRGKASAQRAAEAAAKAPSMEPIPEARPNASRADVRRASTRSQAAASAPSTAEAVHPAPAAHQRRQSVAAPAPEQSRTTASHARQPHQATRKPDSDKGASSTPVAANAVRKPATAASSAARKRSTATRPSISSAWSHQRAAGARPRIVQLEMPLADDSARRSPTPHRRAS
jgi:hypothetical protein